ncbi:hypothetical protein ABK040_010145 [Willaertia magna]
MNQEKTTMLGQNTRSFNFFVKDPSVKIYSSQTNNLQTIATPKLTNNNNKANPNTIPPLGKNSTTVQTRKVGDHHLSHWFLKKDSNKIPVDTPTPNNGIKKKDSRMKRNNNNQVYRIDTIVSNKLQGEQSYSPRKLYHLVETTQQPMDNYSSSNSNNSSNHHTNNFHLVSNNFNHLYSIQQHSARPIQLSPQTVAFPVEPISIGENVYANCTNSSNLPYMTGYTESKIRSANSQFFGCMEGNKCNNMSNNNTTDLKQNQTDFLPSINVEGQVKKQERKYRTSISIRELLA